MTGQLPPPQLKVTSIIDWPDDQKPAHPLSTLLDQAEANDLINRLSDLINTDSRFVPPSRCRVTVDRRLE